jgi:oligopeptide/dipeptide ABC transporter ATP-binding protein
MERAACEAHAAALLDEVGIASARNRLRSYAHELSGGMAQRVMIAMALASRPELLIADEPTTGLDTTIQAQILDLLLEIRRANNMAMILVSHDIGVVREFADRIQVMYSGEIVESGPADLVTTAPAHPYTQALMRSLPGRSDVAPKTRLHTIPGVVPPVGARFDGCRFAPRCDRAQAVCLVHPVPIRSQADGDVLVQCHF